MGESQDSQSHVSQSRPLDPPLDDSRCDLALGLIEACRYDGGMDVRDGVDDLLDSGYSHCNVHRSDTSEMECLQCHLCSGFSDRLPRNGPDGRTYRRPKT
jgi:hypothetical protein